MPGSSTDTPDMLAPTSGVMALDLPRTLKPAPSRTFDFGGPVPPEQRGSVERHYIGDDEKKKPKTNIPTGRFVKNVSAKMKKQKQAGVSQQVSVPDHQEKLTKHGKKQIVTAVEREDKPEPHVQPTRDMDYAKGKRKDAPPPPKRSILRKRPMESGPVQKKQRRVSTHQV